MSARPAAVQEHLARIAPSSPARQAQQGEGEDEVSVANDRAGLDAVPVDEPAGDGPGHKVSRAEAEELLRHRGHGRVEAAEQQGLDEVSLGLVRQGRMFI
jgi:hypothetical protein